MPVPREIDGLVADLFAPLLEGTFASGWSVLGWDGEQGPQLTLGRDGQALLIEFEPLDAARPCFARTRLFNVCARRAFDAPARLDAGERSAVAFAVAHVRAREGRLPTLERSATGRAMAVREVEVSRVLIPEGRGHYYINPYVGCTIGCPFCYVAPRADLSRRLECLPELPWGRYVDVKAGAPEVLAREVKERAPGVVRFSPILTDPYQPLERRHRVTRRCLEVLLPAGFKPVILTRAALVIEDIDLLRRFPAAAVGLSVPTDDDAMRKVFEPGADPIEDRLEALARCKAAGLRTFGLVQPMLPMDPEKLLGRLAPLVDAVRVDRMHGVERMLPVYRAAGLEEAASDAWFEATGRALREGFTRRGVRLDELDDLARLLAL